MELNNRPLVLSIVGFVAFLLVLELGYRLGARASGDDGERAARREQDASTRNQVATLLSLVLGFTLAMALSRFEERLELVLDESNALGTAALRAELLSEPERGEARRFLRDYVDARTEFSKAGLDGSAAIARSRALQAELWHVADSATRQSPTPITALFVQSLNECFDLQGKRIWALEKRIPGAVWAMLAVLSILTALMFGLAMPKRIASSFLVPPLMFAVVMMLIADLDTPGHGLIRVDVRSLERLRDDLGSR